MSGRDEHDHDPNPVLIAFDLLLMLVLALTPYSISARDPDASVRAFD